MTKTIAYTIRAPDEAPQAPERFKLWRYEVTEDSKSHGKFPLGELWYARARWIEHGHERCDLIALAESETMPGGGSFEIYAEWNERESKWGEWLNWNDGEPFDFADLQAALEAEVCATCGHLEDDHGSGGICEALDCVCTHVPEHA
jgi:hypothetical protein